ncbi:hypothetical protein ACFQY7_02855 [Actinomadura luteofluorescens]|uniref:hypothetical protein n=1 Tax=Actinomadura luteofluorescens TaxID=46163 RepID=UPI003637392A
MTAFFDEPAAPFAAANRSRAVAAGLDPHQYDEVTAAWPHCASGRTRSREPGGSISPSPGRRG